MIKILLERQIYQSQNLKREYNSKNMEFITMMYFQCNALFTVLLDIKAIT